MSNHDPISDMLTRIRNASQKKHTTTTIPSSKMSLSIAKVLQKEGFISDINEEGETGRILTEEASLNEMATITGQKALVPRAKKPSRVLKFVRACRLVVL